MKFPFPIQANAEATINRWAAELRQVDLVTAPDDVYADGDILVYNSKAPTLWKRPEWETFVPKFPNVGTTTFTPTLVTSAKAVKFGRTVNLKGNITGTTGGVASGFIYMSLPFPAAEVLCEQIPLIIFDGGGGIYSYADIHPDVNTLRIIRNGAWGIGAGRIVRFSGFYEAAL